MRLPVFGAEVEEFVGAETEDRLAVPGAPGADHVGAGLARELHGGRTDPAGRPVDHDALPGLYSRVHEEPLPGGQSGDRQARAGDEVDVGR
ncbi:hypothetical protein [Leucobacter sp. gxy201]|uniref:hypothetical protein n=1 Tax=Leucobacter sp. gxy201 TaxID=2957200 RepID=UPI003DA048F5